MSIEACTRLGNRPELAITRFHLARLLLDHHPDERAEALAHLDFAIGEFQAMKMAPSLEEAMRLRLHASGADTADPTSSIVAVTKAVQAERPDLSRHAAPDGTVTLLFSDIVDSTPLNETMGDAKWMELLRAHNAIIEEQVRAHGGHVVKTMGDGYMIAFGSACVGLRCALAAQHALAASPPLEGVRVRMGLHTGEMQREGDDFFGRHVTMSARVASAATGGQVLVSSLLKELVGPSGEFSLRRGPRSRIERASPACTRCIELTVAP